MRKSVAASALAIAGLLLAMVVVAAPSASAATIDTTASYVLVNRNSGKALDVYNLVHHRRRPHHPVDPQRRRPTAVAVRRLRRRLLPAQVPPLRQGPRRLPAAPPPTAPRSSSGPTQRHQPAVPPRRLHRRLRPADQPQQRQGPRGPGRLHRRRRQHRPVRRLGRHQPAVAARPRRRHRPRPRHPPTGGTFTNPVVWQDFADGDIIRVGDAYYYSASTMHYSPGAPILRSYDLVNWEYAGPLGAAPRLRRQRLRPQRRPRVRQGHLGLDAELPPEQQHVLLDRLHRVQPHLRLHRLGGRRHLDQAGRGSTTATTTPACWSTTTTPCTSRTATARSASPSSPPTGSARCGPSRCSRRRRASAPWRAPGSTSATATTTSGSPARPTASTCCSPAARSARTRCARCCSNLPGPISGGGVPHQGGLVQTQNGDWYYMAFIDAYPGGRVPALAPITWTADGWPPCRRSTAAGAPRTRSRTSRPPRRSPR